MNTTTPHPPVPVNTLPSLHRPDRSPMDEWIRDAKLRDIHMPAAAALVILIVACGFAATILVAAIVERLS